MSDQVFLNGTAINSDTCPKTDCCNLDICSINIAFIHHIPSLGGTAFFIAVFALLLALQIGLGVFYRTWYFVIAMFSGILLEVLGYAGRFMLRSNPFSFPDFLLYLIPLTIGPAFMCAGIYVCLGRIVVVYGEHISRLRPATYTKIFISSDFLSLVLQALGGAITSSAPDDNQSLSQTGINIMIAGLAMQVGSLMIFITLCGDFALRVARAGSAGWNPAHSDIYNSRRWTGFLAAMCIATITILVRSAFRVAELSQGFDGQLANDEITFLILEGTMVSVACLAMTVCHPGFALKGQWNEVRFVWRKKNQKQPTSEEVSVTKPETTEQSDMSN